VVFNFSSKLVDTANESYGAISNKQATHVTTETISTTLAHFELSSFQIWSRFEPFTKAILCFDFSIAGHLQVVAKKLFIVDR